MTDEDGLLGNLPRTRPGKRSAKREQAPKAAPPPPSEPEPEGSDPVGDALRTAGRALETGAQLAQAITKELLRRVPRP